MSSGSRAWRWATLPKPSPLFTDMAVVPGDHLPAPRMGVLRVTSGQVVNSGEHIFNLAESCSPSPNRGPENSTPPLGLLSTVGELPERGSQAYQLRCPVSYGGTARPLMAGYPGSEHVPGSLEAECTASETWLSHDPPLESQSPCCLCRPSALRADAGPQGCRTVVCTPLPFSPDD